MRKKKKPTRNAGRKSNGTEARLERVARIAVRLYRRSPGNLLGARKTANRGGSS